MCSSDLSVPASPTPPPPPAVGSDSRQVQIDAGEQGVHVVLPPGLDSEDVRDAIEEVRQAIQEAANGDGEPTQPRIIRHKVQYGEDLPTLAFWWILLSAALKISYKGRLQAEVQAAQAKETAEAESLRRQAVEARMAVMQAQIEPHFLFNTLASIDHLIETDPPRASRMQKNLIALLRASMPTLRENEIGRAHV